MISTPEGVGGAERVLEALLAEGARRGWEQRVLNPFSKNPENVGLKALVTSGQYTAMPADRVSQVLGVRNWMAREIRAIRPDIVQAFLPHAGVLAATVPHRLAGTWVFSQQHGRHLVSAQRWGLAALDALAVRRFDQVVACSRQVADFLVSTYRVPRRKIQIIENGWSGSPLPPDRAEWPTAVCVANFRPEKNHVVLLRAFASVVKVLPQSLLVLVGQGPLQAELRREVDALGISKNVDFRGYVDDVWKPLSQAHVFVLPSQEEPFGIAAAEAMAAGLPVVASNVGGLQDIVDPGVTGALVPPGDPEALARSLTSILSDDQLREAMSRAAESASEKYSISRTVSGYFRLYERALSQEVVA